LGEHRGWWRAVRALTCLVLIAALPFAAQAADDEDAASIDAITQAVYSFQQLAMFDPEAAGEIWMAQGIRRDWMNLVEMSFDGETDAVFFFQYAVSFQTELEDDRALAGLYSPWMGTLLLLRLDAAGTQIDGFSLLLSESLGALEGSPEDAALELMDRIEAASNEFASSASRSSLPASTDVSEAVGDYSEQLSPLYGFAGDPHTATAKAILDGLAGATLPGPLSLLAEDDEVWPTTLVPIWFDADSGYLGLASNYLPLSIAWIEFSEDGEIATVSILDLFDRIVTRGGEEE